MLSYHDDSLIIKANPIYPAKEKSWNKKASDSRVQISNKGLIVQLLN